MLNEFLAFLGTGDTAAASTEAQRFCEGQMSIEKVLAALGECVAEFNDFGEVLRLLKDKKDVVHLSKDRFVGRPQNFQKLVTETLGFELVDRRDNWMLVKTGDTLAGALAFAAQKLAEGRRKTAAVQRSLEGRDPDFQRAYKEALEANKAYRSSSNFRPKIIYDDKLAAKKVPSKQSFLDKKRAQLQALAAETEAKYMVGKVVTLREIAANTRVDNRRKLGRQCFDLTNLFRRDQKLSEVTWSDELYYICLGHSRDMANGKVPFGHQGFAGRCNMITFGHTSASENVAYCEGGEDTLATITVDGWIASPGHRRNMVSEARVSAVAAFAKEGSDRYYFTQMFAQ